MAQHPVPLTDDTIGGDGLPEVAHFMPPLEQIRKLDVSSGRLVPRANDTTNEFLNAIFIDGLRASYRRRLILTLEETTGFRPLMEILAGGGFDEEIDEQIPLIMIGALIGIVQLAVQKIDESIEREHAERARDNLKFDAITGLISQTAFNGYGPAVFDKLTKEGRLMAYIVADIDNFKAVNDTKGGHPAGDYVLAELGRIIREQLRGDDIPVRNGGDEFAIVLPDTSHVEAIALAERIRNAVESHEFVYNDASFRVTLSVGVGARCAGDTFADLHKRTDALAYLSKRNGKNRIYSNLAEGMNMGDLPDSVNIVHSVEKPN